MVDTSNSLRSASGPLGGASDVRTGTVDTDPKQQVSRRWRSIWRVHFYSGVFAAPFLMLMAVTGLLILYAQPIQDAAQGNLRKVTAVGSAQSVDLLERAVETAYPDRTVVAMTTPTDASHAYAFSLDNSRDVFVNQYSGKVLGDLDPNGGWWRFARRLHANLNESAPKVKLPAVAALWDDGAVMREYVVGDIVLEIFAVWTMVLVMSGLYLWWPRRKASAASRQRVGRSLFRIRIGKKGRARWRDLHAASGLAMFGIIAVVLVSGMAWSSYWSGNFSSLANELTPNMGTDTPASALGTRGQLDRFGNSIAWNSGDFPIPKSLGLPIDGSTPRPITLAQVVTVAQQERMKPGYSVSFPDNAKKDDAGNPLYGSFTISNSWPRKTGEARDVFVDQFSGATLAQQNAYGFGTVSYAMDSMVSWHMGTQWGLVTRILMTIVSLLTIWMVISAIVMYTKRRRTRSLGLPRRPVDVKMAKRLAILAVVLGIVYPEWGVTALAVLALDRFVIRKVPRLRLAFGQH